MEKEKGYLKKALPNLSFLFITGVLSSIFIFSTQVFLARQLNVSGYGLFVSALATITLLAPLSVFGISHVWLKLYGVEGIQANRWLKVSQKLLLITLTITILIIIFWSYLGPHSSDFRIILLGLLPLVISHLLIELVNTRFQLEGRYGALGLWQNLTHLLRFLFVLVGFTLFFSPFEVKQVVVGYSLISIFVSIFGYLLLLPMLKGAINLDILGSETSELTGQYSDTLSISKVFSQSLPFGLAGIFYLIYLQSDLIFLKYLVDETATGIYAAAFAVMLAIYFIPGVIYQKYLLPKIHGWASHDTNMLLKIFQAGNGLMLLLGLFIFVFVFTLSPHLIPLIFGEAYEEASSVLLILSICIPIRFLATSVESPLFTKDLMKWKTQSMGFAALLNIILNFILIPQFSFYGAALATLVSELVLVILYLVIVHGKLFGSKTWSNWNSGLKMSFWQGI